ncbi:PRC-barrel domain-containing protein [Frigidibacter mobilis]|uniref:PRC-barrel domain-containing protein n=1 Tax=Frigidibacter mobilis TaxID=1335048 RepID=A0A165SW10_9RHOB|nr:PRC-barrel domain-containing protein [Frigidibacter mobilis]AMY71733.1 PRC-barrel domain-containing protein [Frigidibacter mobilis]
MNKLLASTAIVAMTALPLAAQTTTTETTSPETTAPMVTDTAPSTTGSATMDTSTTTDTMGTSGFSYTAMAEDLMASDFTGKNVYVSEGAVATTAVNDADADWDNVGTISDVVMSRDGAVQAILVDVGGFLGIGAKTVAVDMDQLNIISDGDSADDYFVVFTASREALENAPEFVAADDVAATMDTTATGTTAPMATDTTTGMATDTTGVATTDTATGMGSGDPMADMIDPTTLTAEQLQGAPVYDANDERIGNISELVVAADGTITEAVIDIGGFLGIGAKPVALNFEQLQVMAENADGSGVRVHLTATEEELEAMPEYQG